MAIQDPAPTATVRSLSPEARHISPVPDRKNQISSTVRWRTATDVSPGASSKWASPPPAKPSSTRTVDPSGATASGSGGSCLVSNTAAGSVGCEGGTHLDTGIGPSAGRGAGQLDPGDRARECERRAVLHADRAPAVATDQHAAARR